MGKGMKGIGKEMIYARSLLFIWVLSLFITEGLFAEKVLLFTYSYNRPDFIEIQDKTFKKFLKDDYEFIVFNDASNDEMCEMITLTCARLNIRCIRIPQEIHARPYLKRWEGENFNHPAVRNCNVVQYSLDVLGFQHKGIVALFDSDLFLIKEFSIKDILSEHDLAGLPQSRNKDSITIEYLWIGIVFLNMSTMPNHETINFNCGRVKDIPVDAGGHTHCYLEDNPAIRLKRLNILNSPFYFCDDCDRSSDCGYCNHNTDKLREHGFTENEIKFLHAGPTECEFIQDRAFFHYRGGSNWDYRSQEYHKKKTQILYDFIDDIMKD